jgi:tetratricopeptide (TPR) repeat protein
VSKRREGALPAAIACALAALALGVLLPGSGRAQEAETAEDVADLAACEAALRRGQFKSARAALDDYLVEFPRSSRARALRSTLRRREGRYEDAEEDAAAALAAAGEDAATRVGAAAAAFDLHLERGQVESCEKDLEFGLAGAAEGDRIGAPLWSRRVLLLASTGRRKEAYAEFAGRFKDTTRRVEDAPYVLELGRALAALRDWRRAASALSPLEKAWRDARDVRQGEALLLLGRVYRLSHDGGDALSAVDALQDALKIDSNGVDALVELARTRLFRMDQDKADEAVQTALGVNGRSPDAWSVRAELLLLDQRASEALSASENALRENPRHGPALATKTAALGILGRINDAQKAHAQLLAAEPDRGENFCRIADVQNYLYRFREALPNYRRAIHVDPSWSASYVGMARCLVNTGDLQGAMEALRQFRQHDDVPHSLADNTAQALSVLASFVEVKRGTFTYVMHPVESSVLAPVLDELYSRVWPDLCARYGFDASEPVRVECFPRHADFSSRTVGFTGFGALGVCFGSVFTLLSPRSEMRGQFAFDKTAVHELMHVVTLGLSRNKVPRWLTEGISVHEEHVYARNADREMDLDLYNYFKSGEIVPVRELNRLFGGPKILFGYYQGGLLVDFLVEQRGEQVLHDMLELFARDRETPEVVQAVLGMSCEELDGAFLDWLDRTRISRMKVQPAYTEGGRRRLLERVRVLLPGGKPDPELLAQVAWAYHRAGRTVDRDDFLNQALRADPRLPSAHFLLAERALAARRRDEAKREFEAGLEAGGEEFFALLRYVELLARDGDALLPPGARERRPGRARPGAGPPAGGDDVGDDAQVPELDPEQRALRERLLELLARAKGCFPRYVGENSPYVLRAHLLRQLGREEEALDELRAFCGIHESDPQSRRILVKHALERRDWLEARRYLLELRMLDPFERAVWRDLARCEKELGSPAAAIALLERALVIDPSTEPDYDPARAAQPEDDAEARTRAELLLDLAELRLDVGEKADAERALDEARLLKPDPARLEALSRRLEQEGS